MATRTWTGGAGDNNFQTSGNWDTAVPSGTDTIIIAAGSSSITAGLSNTGVTPAEVRVTEGYTGNIGDGTTPLAFGNTTLINCAGRGAYYKFSSSGTVTEANIDLAPQTTFYVSSGTWTDVVVSGTGGKLDVAAAAIVTNGYNASAPVSWEVAANGTGFTIVINAGTIRTRRNIATYTGTGTDRLTTRDTATLSTVGYIANGSIYNHQSSGTILALHALPGSKFPCAGSENSFTITTLHEWAGSSINKAPPGITVTITNQKYKGRQVFAG